MNKQVVSEINRYREIMGLSLVSESTLVGGGNEAAVEKILEKIGLKSERLEKTSIEEIEKALSKDLNIISKVDKIGSELESGSLKSAEKLIDNLVSNPAEWKVFVSLIKSSPKVFSEISDKMVMKLSGEQGYNYFVDLYNQIESKIPGKGSEAVERAANNLGYTNNTNREFWKGWKPLIESLNSKKSFINVSEILTDRVLESFKNQQAKQELIDFINSVGKNKRNFGSFNRGNGEVNYTFISAKGNEVPVSTLDSYVKGKLSGYDEQFNGNLNKLPNNLADGTPFRSKIENIMKKELPDDVLKNIPNMDLSSRWSFEKLNQPLNTLVKTQYKATENLVEICNQFKNIKFDPTKIKIEGRQYINGRNVLEVVLPNDKRILMYESAGMNTKTTGKQSGEWFPIAGFGKNSSGAGGWFIKYDINLSITKNNQYFKDFEMFLKNIHGYK